MTSSAQIGQILDPLIDPAFADQELFYDKIENAEVKKDYLRGFRRSSTYAIDWAGDKLLIATKDNALHLFDPERDEEENSWPGEWMSMQCDPNHPHVAAVVSWNGKFKVIDTRAGGSSVYDVDLKKSSA